MPRSPSARVARVAADARRTLAQLSRPAKSPGSFDASRYFRGTADLGFYNIGAGAVRQMARDLVAQHRAAWSVDDAIAFADVLIRDRYLEAKGLGVEVLARYRRALQPEHLRTFKGWLAANHSANWATTDSICGSLIGPLLEAHPKLARGVAAWSGHRNMWVRRASAVGLIPSARKGLALDAAYRVARRLHADREDLIQKAVGWLLREAGKTDEGRLDRYLRANGSNIPRTTVRYAIERFHPRRRWGAAGSDEGLDGREGQEGREGSACGHASARTVNPSASIGVSSRRGCPPSPRLRRVRRSSRELRERRLEGPAASAEEDGREGQEG